MRWLSRNSNPYMNPAYKSAQTDRPRGDSGYGIGLILGANDGFERIRHTGYITPYTATMNVYPKLKLGVFTAANGPSKFVNHDAIHDELFEIMRGIKVGPNRGLTREFEPSVPSPENHLTPDPADSILGSLFNEYSQMSPLLIPALVNSVRLNHTDLVGSYGSGIAGMI